MKLNNNNNSVNIINIHLSIITLYIIFYILYIGGSLIIPFLIALLFSFAIIGLNNFYSNLFKIPNFISTILSIISYIFIFWLIGKMIGSNILELKSNINIYQNELQNLINSFFSSYNIPKTASVNSIIDKINISKVFSYVAGGVTSILSSTGMIFFYVMFILLEYRYFGDKINLMVQNKEKGEKILETIKKINSDIKSYFVIKTIVSICTGILSYLVLSLIGLNFAVFWAFLIFLLNYIPSVGSIFAITFPIIFSLIQPNFGVYDIIIMSSGLIGVQILMGNIIEPKFMGNKLNLSPLVIIISLGFWGAIWGIVGMFLSVPLMVMINIILSKFESTRPIAVLLSEKGIVIENSEESENIKKNKKILLNKIKKVFFRK